MGEDTIVPIGFDVRVVLREDAIARLDQIGQMVTRPCKSLATADALVQRKPSRYRHQENSSDAETSILGCFRPIGRLLGIVRADLQADETIYIYRVRREVAAYIIDRFGPIEDQLDMTRDAADFKPIGFDVIDMDGWTSGLWGCSFEAWEKRLWEPVFRTKLSDHGLFNEESLAAYFAQCRGLVISEHSPFIPVELMAIPNLI